MKDSIKSIKIAKGVSLKLFQTKSFKTAQASISMAMPLNDGKNAARALLIYLLARTNRDYPTIKEMGTRLNMLYGSSISPSVIKSGETQIIRLSLECIDDKFALGNGSIIYDSLSLMLDMLFKPNLDGKKFRDEDVKREKRLMVQRILSLNDDKIAYAANRLIEEMCKDEVYSVKKYGTVEEVEALTGEDIFSAFMQVLLEAPIQINVVGNFDEEKITELIKERFAVAERNNVAELHTEFLSEAYEERTVREAQELNQCKLVMGFRAGMTYDLDNYPAVKLMTDILGGGTYSKLFMNVREKLSLCYYCSCFLDRNKGIILVQSGVEKNRIDQTVKAIRNELEQIVLGNFDDEVIRSAKLSLSDSLDGVFDSPEGIDGWYSSQQTSSTVKTPSQVKEEINAVTKEEIMTAASFVTLDTIYILEN